MDERANSRPVAWEPVFCWALVAGLLLFLGIRVLGLDRGFPLVPLIALTPQAAGAALVVAVVALALRVWPAAAVAVAVAVVLTLLVLPRTRDHSDPNAPGATLKVLAINSKRGHASAADIVQKVRDHDVDLLAVEELTPGLAHYLEEAGISTLLPNGALTPRPDAFGSGLYADFPLEAEGAGQRARAQQHAAGRPPGAEPVQITAVHPQSPLSLADVGAWDGALDDLPGAGDEGPLNLLLGDFNATLDNDKLRDLISTGYTDAGAETGRGLAATFPGDGPWPRLIAIDHVLVDDRAAVRDYEVVKIAGSDHRAVYAELALPLASAAAG